MIKRTEISQQKTPKVLKNKNGYSNKGNVSLKLTKAHLILILLQSQVWAKVKPEEWA